MMLYADAISSNLPANRGIHLEAKAIKTDLIVTNRYTHDIPVCFVSKLFSFLNE